MDNNTTKYKLQALYILLFFTFFFSQNITWSLIQLIPNINEYIFVKSVPLYQACYATLYIATTIITTSDNDVLHAFIKNHPKIKRFIEKSIYYIIRLLSGFLSFLLHLPDIISLNGKSTEIVVAESKKDSADIFKQFYSPIFEIRLFGGLACLFLIILLVTLPFSETIISYIADILSLLAALIGCLFVANNAKSKIIKN